MDLHGRDSGEGSKCVDEELYTALQQIGFFHPHECLNGDKVFREGQKQCFMEASTRNPLLDYPLVSQDADRFSKMENALLELRERVRGIESNTDKERGVDFFVAQNYRYKINEAIAQIRMLRAVANNDMKRFSRYAHFIYGEPSPDVFAYTVNNLRAKLSAQVESGNEEISGIARELLNVFQSDLPISPESSLVFPNDDSVSIARGHTTREMSSLLDVVHEKEGGGSYSAEEIRSVFESVLVSLHADGWEAFVDTDGSRSIMSVDQELKRVNIPGSFKLSYSRLRELIVHEIGTHVLRRLNGERSKLRLLGIGLHRYEKGEEGVATMREQVLKDDVDDFAYLERHLAISLAKGLDGKPRDFRDVYEILEKYFRFDLLTSGKKVKDPAGFVRNKAWNLAVRVFRGTDCNTLGVCFTKDIAYSEGNIGVWDVIGKNPDEMMRFSVGKYDPTRPDHVLLLDMLGITDNDLSDLAK